MKRPLLWSLLGGAAVLAAVAGYRLGVTGKSTETAAATVPALPIFELTLTDLNGQGQSFGQWRGKVLIVNYWATWCEPCREEIPMFVRLQREYVVKNVQFVGIAVDQADKVREFAKEFNINYPLLIGGMDAVELSRQAGNKAGVLPYTLVINPKGQIAASLVGGISEERMRNTLLPLL